MMGGYLNVFPKYMLTEEQPGMYKLKFQLDFASLKDRKSISVLVPIEMRREKQPDSQVYSLRPSLNSYLSNISIIGNDAVYDEGQNYIRFLLSEIVKIDLSRIESVRFHTYALDCEKQQEIELYSVTNDWCSLTTSWNQKASTGTKVTSQTINRSGEQIFDIATAAKEWFNDAAGQKEYFGLLMQAAPGSQSTTFLSNDNSLYWVKTEIVFE